ncbi:hypothetical protein BIW11_10523 [Tropilaelaps mercedesae]|uniref:Uncharacterized protein n=1 Tax=Tropilaelaps mercedesae TaxID=418985 RepID=A0A1V9XFP9_9ACAR|nr:hypothetical protein BIW11_10523 [Tropilaelaps mercedesae]
MPLGRIDNNDNIRVYTYSAGVPLLDTASVTDSCSGKRLALPPASELLLQNHSAETPGTLAPDPGSGSYGAQQELETPDEQRLASEEPRDDQPVYLNGHSTPLLQSQVGQANGHLHHHHQYGHYHHHHHHHIDSSGTHEHATLVLVDQSNQSPAYSSDYEQHVKKRRLRVRSEYFLIRG